MRGRTAFDRHILPLRFAIDFSGFAEDTTSDIKFGRIEECQIVKIGRHQDFCNLLSISIRAQETERYTHSLLQELLELIQYKRAFHFPFRSHQTDFNIHNRFRCETVPDPITRCWFYREDHIPFHGADNDGSYDGDLDRFESDGYGGEERHGEPDFGVGLVFTGNVSEVSFERN